MQGAIKELENSEIEIVGQIDGAKFASYRAKAIKSLSENISIKGFRTGHIPEDVILQNVGEISVLEEMAEIALRDLYPKFVSENKIDALGRPEISITKIAKDNPLEFKIKTAVMPKIKMTDYKEISKSVWSELGKEKVEVSEKEIDDVVMEIRRARAAKNPVENKEHACDDRECKEGHEKKEEKDAPLPEITEEFVKTIGNFKGVADFREKIKKNLESEKEHSNKEKGRSQILDKLIEKTDIKVPNVLIEAEENQILHEVKGKIEQLGLSFEDYLKQANKTEDDIKKEAKEPAVKRVKYKLILKAIAEAENIKIPVEEVMKEVDNLMKYYQNADVNSAKIYVEDSMINEKVFELLDGQR